MQQERTFGAFAYFQGSCFHVLSVRIRTASDDYRQAGGASDAIATPHPAPTHIEDEAGELTPEDQLLTDEASRLLSEYIPRNYQESVTSFSRLSALA
jgi:hypothetical protein